MGNLRGVVSQENTVGDSGVGQQQLNGSASKNTLQPSEFNENQRFTSLEPMEKTQGISWYSEHFKMAVPFSCRCPTPLSSTVPQKATQRPTKVHFFSM